MNPYFYPSQVGNAGLFSRIFPSGISLSSILNGTSKTLNMINQAIPVIKQIGPTVQNAKTMFRVMNEFKKVDTPIQNTPIEMKETENIVVNTPTMEVKKEVSPTSSPTFFL